jgi:hypothetical protein
MDDHGTGPNRCGAHIGVAKRGVAAGAELKGEELKDDEEARGGRQDRRQARHAALLLPLRPGPIRGRH